MSNNDLPEFEALQKVIEALRPLADDDRRRVLASAATFLRIDSDLLSASRKQAASPIVGIPASVAATLFSDNNDMGPKEFLYEKQPRTDVERIACLAYYLTHYRATPHFKTIDLSKLNIEAAQPKFANAAAASNNAVRTGFLVASTRGQRQLSAPGERFIRALPDRELAKTTFETLRRKPRARKLKAAEA